MLKEFPDISLGKFLSQGKLVHFQPIYVLKNVTGSPKYLGVPEVWGVRNLVES